MSTYYGKRERRVIPRWRSTAAVIGTPEVQPIDAQLPQVPWERETLEMLAHEWKTRREIFVASDLVGAAVTLRFWDFLPARDAATFLVGQKKRVPSVTYRIAEEYLAGKPIIMSLASASVEFEQAVIFKSIRNLKARLISEPRNAIARVELSRYYASIGQKAHAESEMIKALSLAPMHRFVMRSASRLFVHLDEPDRALKLLSGSPRTKYDPWLMAAEIAIASVASKASQLAKLGKQVLSAKRYSAIETSELAAALGTLEIEHGNKRIAKKFFRQAMLDPTDNSVAQAEWAGEKLGEEMVADKHLSIPLTFEAKALEAYHESDWRKAVQQSRLWFADEPFSTRPLVLASFSAAVGLEDYRLSAEMAQQGLVGNRDDITLLNNLVYALSKAGDHDGARREYERFSKFNLTGVGQVLYLATGGLLKFQEGDIDAGRTLYGAAFEKARDLKDQRLIASAVAFYAMEEAPREKNLAMAALEQAKKINKTEKLPGLSAVISKAEKAMEVRDQKQQIVQPKIS